MKKVLSGVFAFSLIAALATGCNQGPSGSRSDRGTGTPSASPSTSDRTSGSAASSPGSSSPSAPMSSPSSGSESTASPSGTGTTSK